MTIEGYTSRLDVMTVPLPKATRPWPQPFDAYTLATALGLSTQALWYFVLNTCKLYERHTIPKKSGGMRMLHVPDHRLAFAQRRVLDTFLHNFVWPEHVSAYVPGRAPRDAATQHAGRPFLAVVDIKDFFPSTRRTWVRDAISSLLELPKQTSELLATLVTAPWVPNVNERYRVPQGAPSSGAIANLVALHRLDPLILEVCAKYGMTYTRYADDLAFSREAPVDREEASAFIKAIIAAVKASGYRVNYDKIRVQRRNRQQRLLGLTINEHPNIPKRDYRRMRAMVHHCKHKGYAQVASERGFESGEALVSYLDGIIAYYHGVAPAKAAALRSQLQKGP